MGLFAVKKSVKVNDLDVSCSVRLHFQIFTF